MNPHSAEPNEPTVAAHWQGSAAGARYSGERFGTPGAAARDPRLVARALARHGVEPSAGGVLDAPCGSGRLRDLLEGLGQGYVGVDVSPSMLAEGPPGRVTRGSAFHLPFPDGTFDVVVCCRLLHHLDEDGVAVVVRELLRVSSRMILASFWDSGSLHAWRRRTGRRRGRRPDSRRAIDKAALEDFVNAAGGRVLGYEHSLRFVSQQAFLVASKRAG